MSELISMSGHPKSGTHALMKAVELLGVPVSESKINPPGLHTELYHLPWRDKAKFDEHRKPSKWIFIKRDPRNLIISQLRHWGKSVTPGTILAHMSVYDARTGMSFADSLELFRPWLQSDALVISFEDLIANDSTMRRIADYLQVPYIEDAWEELPGGTSTWSGRLSDWRNVWNELLHDRWRDLGGEKLVQAWGYF